tara:strand:- start:529 stop:936 length:408 start_codon:yes stop_codon:yes gene_type:complete
MGETPSANAHCSARGLAKLAAMLAQGGEFGGMQILSEAAWNAMHDNPVTSIMGLKTTFTQGGIARFDTSVEDRMLETALNHGREGFCGWMGLGGSLFQWHPEKKVGFAFVPTTLHTLDFINERGKVFQTEILKII